jgi:GNAT superfamily N-acetyltransferase
VALVRALAEFERLPPPDDAACDRLLADAFADPPRYELFVAVEDAHGHVPGAPPGSGGIGAAQREARAADGPPDTIDGDVVAYAVAFPTYSTFLARPTLFLEDLFVHPRARRRGIATAMLDHLRALAAARGCGRFEWTVLGWNEGARALYARFGAELLEEWKICRVTIPAITSRR